MTQWSIMDFMSKGKWTGLFRDLSEVARRSFFSKHVTRFTLVLGVGLFVDYLRELARPCQFLTTPYEFLFCPLVMYIYARHDGFMGGKRI
jgi:hypothetical protein